MKKNTIKWFLLKSKLLFNMFFYYRIVLLKISIIIKSIISSDCPSGPKEFLDGERGGYLFKSNSSESLFNSIEKFKKTSKNKLNTQIIYAKCRSKTYKSNYHKNLFSKYLDQ